MRKWDSEGEREGEGECEREREIRSLAVKLMRLSADLLILQLHQPSLTPVTCGMNSHAPF